MITPCRYRGPDGTDQPGYIWSPDGQYEILLTQSPDLRQQLDLVDLWETQLLERVNRVRSDLVRQIADQAAAEAGGEE